MIKTLNNLAVIILNYNSSELSIAATKNILDLKTGTKVIVVDNCSTDNSQEVLDEKLEAVGWDFKMGLEIAGRWQR